MGDVLACKRVLKDVLYWDFFFFNSPLYCLPVSLQVRHRVWIHPHRPDSHQCLTAIETSEKKMSPSCNVIIPPCSILGFALSLHKCFCFLAAIVLYYLEAEQTEMRPPSPFLCLLIQSSLARRCTHHRDRLHQRTHWIRSGGSPRSTLARASRSAADHSEETSQLLGVILLIKRKCWEFSLQVSF